MKYPIVHVVVEASIVLTYLLLGLVSHCHSFKSVKVKDGNRLRVVTPVDEDTVTLPSRFKEKLDIVDKGYLRVVDFSRFDMKIDDFRTFSQYLYLGSLE